MKAKSPSLTDRLLAEHDSDAPFELPPETWEIPRWISRTSYCDRSTAMTRVGRMIERMGRELKMDTP